MSYTYTSYVAALANELVVPATDPGFVQALPSIIDEAEQRCYRELDLLSTIVRDSSGVLTPNFRIFTFPQHFVVSESINVFTPVNTLTTRTNLVPVSREWIDAVWGFGISTIIVQSVPSYYAMLTDQSILVAPPPDAAYTVEVIGTIRPVPLSASNTTTYLSLYLPDLFFAASMIRAAAYQQNFGSSADNPQQSMSWQANYDHLFASANIEENRKKYASQAWTSKQPAPLATPPRV